MWDDTRKLGRCGTIQKNSIGTIGTMQGQCHRPKTYDKMSSVQNGSAMDL